MVYVQANATKSNPIEITYLYRNTGFNRSEANISNAWQGTAFDVRARDNGGNWNGNAEHWNHNYDSYQIATVPDGLYSLKVQGFFRMGSAENAIAQRNAGTEALNAIFYANNKEKNLMSILDAGSGLPDGNTYTGFEGKQPSVPAYRAYLNAPNAGGRAFISFADNSTTAIQALEALTNNKAEIYDLNGRKLPKLQKGVNIVNGTKVIVK